MSRLRWLSVVLTLSPAFGQTPPVITLQDALARARQYGTQIQSANLNVALAKEDRVQAKAAGLPSVNAFNQFIYTEGNGTPSGVFVANDGVHIYNEQAQVHEEVLCVRPARRGSAGDGGRGRGACEGRRGAARTDCDGGAGLLHDPRGAAEAGECANQPARGGAIPRHHAEAGKGRRSGACRCHQGADHAAAAPARSAGRASSISTRRESRSAC